MKSKLVFKVHGKDVEIDYIKDFIGVSDSISEQERNKIIMYLTVEGFLDPNIIMGMKKLIGKKSK
jgi:hypothetical protein